MRQDVQGIIDAQAEIARGSLRKTGNFDARMVHIYSKSGMIEQVVNDVGLFLENDYSKKVLVEASYEFVRKRESRGYTLLCAVMISDTYLSMQKADDIENGKYIKASQDPKRTEALMICACFKEHNEVSYYPYTREGASISFKEPITAATGIGGHFSKLFPPSHKTTS